MHHSPTTFTPLPNNKILYRNVIFILVSLLICAILSTIPRTNSNYIYWLFPVDTSFVLVNEPFDGNATYNQVIVDNHDQDRQDTEENIHLEYTNIETNDINKHLVLADKIRSTLETVFNRSVKDIAFDHNNNNNIVVEIEKDSKIDIAINMLKSIDFFIHQLKYDYKYYENEKNITYINCIGDPKRSGPQVYETRILTYFIIVLTSYLSLYDITYVPIKGTNLGLYLCNDLLPWDPDVDILLTYASIWKLTGGRARSRQYTHKYNNNNNNNYHRYPFISDLKNVFQYVSEKSEKNCQIHFFIDTDDVVGIHPVFECEHITRIKHCFNIENNKKILATHHCGIHTDFQTLEKYIFHSIRSRQDQAKYQSVSKNRQFYQMIFYHESLDDHDIAIDKKTNENEYKSKNFSITRKIWIQGPRVDWNQIQLHCLRSIYNYNYIDYQLQLNTTRLFIYGLKPKFQERMIQIEFGHLNHVINHAKVEGSYSQLWQRLIMNHTNYKP